jgi:hypothetical protein
MEHTLSSKANILSASQEIPLILWNWKLITQLTIAQYLSLSWTKLTHSTPSQPNFTSN